MPSRIKPDQLLSLKRAGELFYAILDADGRPDPNELCAQHSTSPATLYRHIRSLVEAGLLVRTKKGQYSLSPSLLLRTENHSFKQALSEVARPVLQEISNQLQLTTHLGILEEDMVTYLIKISGGPLPVFTTEQGQLEAYCSAIGKVLLSALAQSQLDGYLAEGPFPQLTQQTIVDPHKIGMELKRVRRLGYAIDNEEVAEDLVCLAIPVNDCRGVTVAAISVSAFSDCAISRRKRLAILREASHRISARI